MVTVLIIGVGAFLLGRGSAGNTEIATITSPTPTIQTPPSATPSQPPTAQNGWLTYTDDTAGFSIQYPDNMFTLCDSDSGGDLDGIWFWPKGWNCETPSGGGYSLMIARSTKKHYDQFKPVKTPDVNNKILIDGKTAYYQIYRYTEKEDPFLSQFGEIRHVVLETGNWVYKFEILTKDPKTIELIDEMITTLNVLD